MSGYRLVEKPNGAIGGQMLFQIMSPGGLVAASVIGVERRHIAEMVLAAVNEPADLPSGFPEVAKPIDPRGAR